MKEKQIIKFGSVSVGGWPEVWGCSLKCGVWPEVGVWSEVWGCGVTCGSIHGLRDAQRSVGLLVHLALTLLPLQGANPVGQVSKRPVTAGNAFKTSMLELVAHLEAKVEGRGGRPSDMQA